MDDDDFNLSLNLTNSSGQHSRKSTKQKVFGNRTERIKQRRQIKLQKQKVGHDDSKATSDALPKRRRDASSDDEIQDSPPSKVPKKEGSHFGALRKSDKGRVISSLFRHNPDIPTVKSESVKGLKEEIFASTKFSDLPLHPHLISNLEEKMKLATMTRVQQLSIPVILREKDVLVKSQTGSGKTLAYAVPIVHTLASLPRKLNRTNGVFALIIVPTRELAIQSYNTFSKLLQSAVWLVAGCLMGGEKRKAEKARIRKGINILVSTPGRLLDHLKRTDCLSLHRVQWLVIDEADRLLEMGYEKDVAEIVTILKSKADRNQSIQTILLSATLTAGVERLSGMALRDHESIDASEEGGSTGVHPEASGSGQETATFALPEKLVQHFVVVPCKLRLVTLAAFVLWKCKMQSKRSKMLVFLSTQDSVEFHHQIFTHVLNSSPTLGEGQAGPQDTDTMDLFKLHGDMAQKDRTEVFQDFAAASSGVLFCTDVASRGLHLPRVDWIVQYTTPGATVDYIHRVGRTARAGKQGNALLFLMPSEASYVQELNKHNISLREMSMKDVLKTLLTAIHDLPQPNRDSKRQMPRTFEEASTFMQDQFEESVIHQRLLQMQAVKGYESFVRAYATYPAPLKQFFSLKELHLGHVAKSFALREAPSKLHRPGVRGRGRGKGKRSEGNPRLKFDSEEKRFGRPQKKHSSSSSVWEFGSGLVSKKNKKSSFG